MNRVVFASTFSRERIASLTLLHLLFTPQLYKGTISPTGSPIYEVLDDAGGCPDNYSSGNNYEVGDMVAVEGNGVDKIVWQCRSFPDDNYCTQYEPGHWSKLGWMILGYCSGKKQVASICCCSHNIINTTLLLVTSLAHLSSQAQ